MSNVEYRVSGLPPLKAEDMTLRDWFAGQALAILRPSEKAFAAMGANGLTGADADRIIAASAYALADAMLKASRE